MRRLCFARSRAAASAIAAFYREGFDVTGVEQNLSVFVGDLQIPQTQRMYQNFNKSQDRSDDKEVALVYRIEERLANAVGISDSLL